MATRLIPRAYRLDPVTIEKIDDIVDYLQSQAIPGTPDLTEVAAIRHAIHVTHASIPKRRKKNPQNS